METVTHLQWLCELKRYLFTFSELLLKSSWVAYNGMEQVELLK